MATMKEVEKMIRGVRECDNMIRYITEYDVNPSMTAFLRGTCQGTRDAMIGGLIERKQNLSEALAKLGIVDEVA